MYPSEGEILEGKYRIERKLGEGGMGAVFRATHVLRKAPVALKIPGDAAARDRDDEAEAVVGDRSMRARLAAEERRCTFRTCTETSP